MQLPRGRSWRRSRGWPCLELPRWLLGFVVLVVAADAAAITLAARHAQIVPAALLIFGLLLACSAVTVELTRRLGESALYVQDICGVWELPAAVLLPPVLAMLAPLPRVAMTQWRVRQVAPHRRIFSAAAISLSFGLVSVLFHLTVGQGRNPLAGGAAAAAGWILAVALCGVVQWMVNHGLVMVAVKGSDRTASVRRMLFGRQNLHNYVTEISVGVVVAAGVAVSPAILVFALPFVGLLQRSLRHAELLDAARVDAKTGVLNAETWRREASLELARAQRTGTSLALLLIDIDHFKSVNDRYGHLAGDDALRAVCRAIQDVVREHDAVGRFGGEEFSVVLPQAGSADAMVIAERIRSRVAALMIEPTAAATGQPIRLTVSAGVAVLGRRATDVTELLAAADVSLYRAKEAGRNQVRLSTRLNPETGPGRGDTLETDLGRGGTEVPEQLLVG